MLYSRLFVLGFFDKEEEGSDDFCRCRWTIVGGRWEDKTQDWKVGEAQVVDRWGLENVWNLFIFILKINLKYNFDFDGKK